MRAITLKKSEFLTFKNTSFLVLGDETKIKDHIKENRLEKKLLREEKKTLPGVWGTIGWKNDANFDISGEIRISRNGNISFKEKKGYKRQIINDLLETNEQKSIKTLSIREYFIDMSDIEIKFPKEFDFESIPTFRFELFLEPDQGAVAYIDHNNKSGNEEDDFVEFVMCERTNKEYSTDRDRLTYFIPAVPKHKIEQLSEDKFKLATELQVTRPTLRILTFRRKKETAGQIVDAITSLFKQKSSQGNVLVDFMLRHETYAFTKFNSGVNYKPTSDFAQVPMSGIFEHCSPNQIDPNAKTLLLIHGTFSSTFGSFGELLKKQGTSGSVLDSILSNGYYEQILAFDHVTIKDNAADNANWLLNHLVGFSFSNPIDVITTSRGALVAEHISQDTRFKNKLEFNRVLMFSAAHGCGYFKAGPFVSKGLSVLKLGVSNVAAKILIGYLQNSVQYFLEQKGSVMLHVDSDVVKAYLSAQPNNQNTHFVNVIADWDKKLKNNGKFKKGAIVLDVVIKGFLGKENDWVIGCEQQKLKPLKAQDGGEYKVYSVHGGTFDNSHAIYRGENSKTYNALDLIIEALNKQILN